MVAVRIQPDSYTALVNAQRDRQSAIEGGSKVLKEAQGSRVDVAFKSESKQSPKLGEYRKFKIVDDSSMGRRHRYIRSWFKSAFQAIGKFFKSLSFKKPYLRPASVTLRKQLSPVDRKALNATMKVFGTAKGQSLLQEDGFINGQYGESVTAQSFSSIHDIRGKVDLIKEDFKEGLVPEKGFYEIQMTTAIVGITTEAHVISIIIDPSQENIYLVDSKGVAPDKLFFYNNFSKGAFDVTVADFISVLKEENQDQSFSNYSLIETPAFQKVGDCSATTEAFSRALAVSRYTTNLVAESRIAPQDQTDCSLSDFEVALGTVHGNYEELITRTLRPQLVADGTSLSTAATAPVAEMEEDDGVPVVGDGTDPLVDTHEDDDFTFLDEMG